MLRTASSLLRTRSPIGGGFRDIVNQRGLSVSCTQSLHKLKNILEEYRTTNYTQEFPKRFAKDIIHAATKVSSRSLYSEPRSGVISIEGIEHVLNNIGAQNKMSRAEIEFILRELGGRIESNDEKSSFIISADQFFDLIVSKKTFV
ncbi:hypothetical protein ACHAXS_000344 [Conticribra weissflogii]